MWISECTKFICNDTDFSATMSYVWIAHIIVIGTDILCGLIMFITNYYRYVSRTENKAHDWEKCITIYAACNTFTFIIGVASVITYLWARNTVAGSFTWIFVVGMQVMGRLIVWHRAYHIITRISVPLDDGKNNLCISNLFGIRNSKKARLASKTTGLDLNENLDAEVQVVEEKSENTNTENLQNLQILPLNIRYINVV